MRALVRVRVRACARACVRVIMLRSARGLESVLWCVVNSRDRTEKGPNGRMVHLKEYCINYRQLVHAVRYRRVPSLPQ
jgi:hypothetical protein